MYPFFAESVKGSVWTWIEEVRLVQFLASERSERACSLF